MIDSFDWISGDLPLRVTSCLITPNTPSIPKLSLANFHSERPQTGNLANIMMEWLVKPILDIAMNSFTLGNKTPMQQTFNLNEGCKQYIYLNWIFNSIGCNKHTCWVTSSFFERPSSQRCCSMSNFPNFAQASNTSVFIWCKELRWSIWDCNM